MADPFCRPTDFHQGLLRPAQVGRLRAQRRPRTRSERIGRTAEDAANKREDINEILAGDICAAVGLKNVSTGDTICDEKHPIALENITFAVPGFRYAVEPKTKSRSGKDGHGAFQIGPGRPTFQSSHRPRQRTDIISGMGELHLEIIVDRMMREYKVEANVGKPQVAYRETIRRKSGSGGKYIRQTGGRGQYGHAKIRLEPNEPGKVTSLSTTWWASVPKDYQAHRSGNQEAMEGGVLAGL